MVLEVPTIDDNISLQREKDKDNQPDQTDEQESKTTQEAKLLDVPKAFVCSITNEIMKDPVVGSDGKSYEKTAEAATDGEFYPNRVLKACIQQKECFSALKACIGDLQQKAREDKKSRKSIRQSLRGFRRSGRSPIFQSLRSIEQAFSSRGIASLPDEFYCPITHGLMCQPTIDPDGNTYEKDAIVAWIEEHGTSPVTRRPLSIDDLYDNTALVELMKEIFGMTAIQDAQSSIRQWKNMIPSKSKSKRSMRGWTRRRSNNGQRTNSGSWRHRGYRLAILALIVVVMVLV
ncbi:SAM and U-box domain-containing protein 1 [Seminavis robusta]|uniref:SAM and U-box domain-containing protein 1 n=1 Tax=Seminavis robusta TaxID=568900 RepID=A0A9N8HRW2_9STRA|nr:SAM and U-box domain-containing protein 1 [Seminavis robusta]|eukprot:Sro1111_g242410.1 SAM and U-box domain-containing protein 1 (289) ;mRNA; r:6977-7843